MSEHAETAAPTDPSKPADLTEELKLWWGRRLLPFLSRRSPKFQSRATPHRCPEEAGADG
jgi:hypothetical protein